MRCGAPPYYVLDEARKAGIQKVLIETESRTRRTRADGRAAPRTSTLFRHRHPNAMAAEQHQRSQEKNKKARIEIDTADRRHLLPSGDFFVLFTLSLEQDRVVCPCSFPSPRNRRPLRPTMTWSPSRSPDAGTCYWNRELISRDEITPRLEQYKKATQNPRVLIAGDSKAKFGFTVYAAGPGAKGRDRRRFSVETRVRKTGE